MAKLHSPIHAGDMLTAFNIKRIYDGFLDKNLPKQEWTHAAHLITGLCLIRDFGLIEAEAKMPNMIRAFNETKGGINSDTEGYHHTITIFYLRVLAKFSEENRHMNFSKLCAVALQGALGTKDYVFSYYSKELLFSKEARKIWMESDLLNI